MKETFLDTKVTHTPALEGKLYVIENVPARVCIETGEQFFSPETLVTCSARSWRRRSLESH